MAVREAKDWTVRPTNIDALTGIRFVAALTIVLAHIYSPLGSLSIIGMPLFFTLSGFIIHYVYSGVFAGGWGAAAATFAAARFSRIYPLYLILLIVELLLTPLGNALYQTADIGTALAYIFACWTWLPSTVGDQSAQTLDYSVSWSVSTEIFFYICYALVFYRLRAIRDAKSCLVILLIFCACAYGLFYLLFLMRDAWEGFALQRLSGFSPRTTDFNNSLYRWFLYFSPYCRIFEFVGGCLTCQLFLLLRDDRSLRWFRVGWPAWLAVLLIAVTVAIYDHVAGTWPWLAINNRSLPSFFVSLHMNFLLAPACYLLIFSLACGGSIWARIFSARLPVFLGEISYSTYLGHALAVGLILHTSLAHVRHVTTAVELVAIYVMSWMFYSAFEVPAKQALRRLFAIRRAKPLASAVVAGE
jgi:peptidoglycan/LPS O-acetylase OafA/YrhL